MNNNETARREKGFKKDNKDVTNKENKRGRERESSAREWREKESNKQKQTEHMSGDDGQY